MIIVRTNCDLATEYTYAWTEPIITEAQARGFKVTLVQGNNVGIQHFNKRIHKIKPKLIMFNGHGSKNCFYDNNWEEVMNLNSVHLLKNSITFARACDCLIELGSKAVQEGCLAFIGYNRKFMIPRWHSQTCKPLSDPAAKPVMECSNSVVLELLKNKTVKEAVWIFRDTVLWRFEMDLEISISSTGTPPGTLSLNFNAKYCGVPINEQHSI